jgi:hypothetical protein
MDSDDEPDISSIIRSMHTDLRTSGSTGFHPPHSSDDDEDPCDSDWPVAVSLRQISASYAERDQSDPPIAAHFSPLPSSTINFSPTDQFALERCFIYAQYFPPVLQGRRQNVPCLHSWVDMASVANVEAIRSINAFIDKGYESLDPSAKPRIEVLGTDRGRITWPILGNAVNRMKTFHYIGMGCPSPTADRIFAFGDWAPLGAIELVQPPCFHIFDCDRASVVRATLLGLRRSPKHFVYALFACGENEQLLIPPHLPQNFFTCILLTPLESFSAVHSLRIPPTAENCQRFNRMLSIFCEGIALDLLEPDLFQGLFRSGQVGLSLWARFMLSQRLMRRFGLHSQSIPKLPDMGNHRLWLQFEAAAIGIGDRPVLAELSRMYCHHFANVASPVLYIRAVMGSLLGLPEENAIVLGHIATFMRRSAANCWAMGQVMSLDHLSPHVSARDRGVDYFRDWCVVVSGLFLAVPDLARKVRWKSFDEIKLLDPGTDTYWHSVFCSIMASLRDAKERVTYCLGKRALDALLSRIFDQATDPQVREWIVIVIHATLLVYKIDPSALGKSRLHGYAALLATDKRSLTRAASVSILGHLMTSNYPIFNRTLMQCALQAAVDASAIVRLALVHCLAKYLRYRGQTSDVDQPISFFHRPVDSIVAEPPNAGQVLRFFAADPHPDVREVALAIMAGESVPAWDPVARIHRVAHVRLFSEGYRPRQVQVRYDATLFDVNELENLEVINLKGDVTALSFDWEHGSVCCGVGGNVVWGHNKWTLDVEPIVTIFHCRAHRAIAGSSAGNIWFLLDGQADPIECFRPAFASARHCIVVGIPGTSPICVSLGNSELFVYDYLSFLLIEKIDVPAPITHMAAVGDGVACALDGGRVVRIDVARCRIVRELRFFEGRRIIRIGEHQKKVYLVLNDGRTFLWDDEKEPKQILSTTENVVDVLLHRIYRRALKLTAAAVTLIEQDGRGGIVLRWGGKRPTCCCWDDVRPLCAISDSDGSVAVWRIAV